MNRARFGSRLGFILVSAGCAVGLGNVWKFPYMCGQYGGAIFILVYLVCLAVLGLPIMLCEFSVGRGSQKSVAQSFKVLQPKGEKWHQLGLIGVVGCYMLMMFYASVGGWLLYYCFKTAMGHFSVDPSAVDLTAHVNSTFDGLMGDAGVMTLWTIITIVISFAVCFIGMKNGVEKVTKYMMICLLALMAVLAVRIVTLDGAIEGVKFYLVPNIKAVSEIGFGNILVGAMSQAFFTLSLGIGSMAIFGSYLDKKRSILGESVFICIIDTTVALLAGFIVIPACFAYNVPQDAGPSLIFKTLPAVFAHMSGGRIWGTLFFLFLSFAALTTIITVFENIVAYAMDTLNWSRRKSVLANLVAMIVLSMPCVLGFNVLSGIQPLGAGSTIMDLEDFIVSNNLLPIGSVVYLLFCVKKNGWGWDNFMKEVNAGDGLKMSGKLRPYLTYILPLAVIVIYLNGYREKFFAPIIKSATEAQSGAFNFGAFMSSVVNHEGFVLAVIWTVLAAAFLIWIGSVVFHKSGKKDISVKQK
ncbi:MAG: sodium-dependent transporter [Clostridia bacterium]|nr:sodium-dependent transporter [Clostridia bacterium]